MKNTNYDLSPTRAKYNSARLALLIIVIFTALNFLAAFVESYFLFSAYIPLLLIQVGYFLYAESGLVLFYVVTLVPAAALTVLYFLSWLFSKKKTGWMIAALIFFAIDTVTLLVDFVSWAAIGDFSFAIDLIIHIYILIALAVGVKHGADLKKETPIDYAAIKGNADESTDGEVMTRTLTITRKKRYAGAAVAMNIFVNGQPVATLKSGESVMLTVPQTAFVLGANLQSGFAANQAIIPAGETSLAYTAVLKTGFVTNDLTFVLS